MTPALNGALLPGVTRDTLLTVASDLGYSAEEGKISTDEWQAGNESGVLTEVFACGTAAVITPVGFVKSAHGDWTVGDRTPGPDHHAASGKHCSPCRPVVPRPAWLDAQAGLRVEVGAHITALDREGRRLADAASATAWDASVPSCPGWTVRDLVTHVGGVHRWAAAIVGGALSRSDPETHAAVGSGPPDAQLLDWFRSGHASLVQTLQSADPAVPFWSFLPAATPLASWARRQAHARRRYIAPTWSSRLVAKSRTSTTRLPWTGSTNCSTRSPRAAVVADLTADPPEIIEVRPAGVSGRRVCIGPSGIETTDLEQAERADAKVGARCCGQRVAARRLSLVLASPVGGHRGRRSVRSRRLGPDERYLDLIRDLPCRLRRAWPDHRVPVDT